MLGPDSPWILLADEPGHEVRLGLLWTPPAGGTKCPPEAFADFVAPKIAKVTWSLTVAASGARHTLLSTATSTETTDATATRRFRIIWPFIRPFASVLRMQVLRAIKAHAEGR